MAVDGVIVLKPSQVKIAFCALTALAVFFLLLVRWLPGGWLQGFCAVSGFLVLTSGPLLLLFRWRCPHCGRALPASGILGMEYCPYCGNVLD